MIRCLIVDDEQPGRELIATHLSMFPDFAIIASLDNAIDAFSYIQKHPVDLLFLDVTMPQMSGLQLLRSLTSKPSVILTTAYREYAADAYELEVFDYLVKPITKERFMKAMGRFLQHLQQNVDFSQEIKINNDAYMYFKVGREQVKIYLKDILFIEGLSDYIKVHTLDNSYVASEKLSFLEEKLPGSRFVRIHKSFIISLDKFKSYSADNVKIHGHSLPLGRSFKASFLKVVRTSQSRD